MKHSLSHNLRSFFHLLAQHRFYTAVYVAGTAVTIAFTMVVVMVYDFRTADIAPETRRDRVLYNYGTQCMRPDGTGLWGYRGLGPTGFQALMDSLPGVDELTWHGGLRKSLCSLPASSDRYSVMLRPVAANWFDFFSYHFVAGRPFTRSEYDTGRAAFEQAEDEWRTTRSRNDGVIRRFIVISESLARRLFASTDVAGRTFLYRGNPYTVSGVVADVSSATPDAVADLWMPITLNAFATYRHRNSDLLGNLTCFLLVDDAANKETVKEALRDAVRRHDAGQSYVNDLMGQPDDAALSSFRTDAVNAPDLGGLFRSLLYIVLALLFIPAVNLSGMIASRMDRRMAELGIRKAYGATRDMLLGQVLWENLLLTLIGAVAGLLFCYLIVLTSGSWVLTLFDAEVDINLPAPFLTMEMLFNPWVFLCAFGLCLVLNVVSALLPAWWGLKHTIVQELYTKR